MFPLFFLIFLLFLLFSLTQSIMSQESLSLQFFDVITILLKYCGPKTNENPETQAVIVDLVATLGFLCANNKQNQVRIILISTFYFFFIQFYQKTKIKCKVNSEVKSNRFWKSINPSEIWNIIMTITWT